MLKCHLVDYCDVCGWKKGKRSRDGIVYGAGSTSFWIPSLQMHNVIPCLPFFFLFGVGGGRGVEERRMRRLL